jgi:ribonuclease P protein component
VAYETLRERAGFRRVLARGKSTRSNGVRLHWTHNGMDFNRYGVAATTAVGSAVVRNRVRRWSRELLRQWDAQLMPGHDVVVFVNQAEARESFGEFATHLAVTLKRSQLAEGDLVR